MTRTTQSQRPTTGGKMKPEGYTNVCEQCDAKPLNGVCDCPESLNAEIERLTAINAELLAVCHATLNVATVNEVRDKIKAAIANAQPQGEKWS